MTAWVVYVPDPEGEARVEVPGGEEQCREIDIVFYDNDCDEDYVLRGLINHDGYPSDIIVVPEK